MQSSQIPTRIPTPFGDGAVEPTYRHQVPEDSQIGITNGAASFATGFPPLNFEPVASGGVPPFGNDMNGLLYQMTQWLRWTQSGGIVPWDETFSTAIGGYPLGAVVASATVARKFWVSTAENNTTDPDDGGAGWQATYVGNSGATPGSYSRPLLTVDAAGRVTAIASGPTPTRQTFTSGSGSYITPANCIAIKVTVVGGGGGSGISGSPAAGGASSFNSVTALGGSPGGVPSGSTPGAGGAGGNGGSGGGSLITRIPGQAGAKGCGGAGAGSPVSGIIFAGGQGGSTIFGFGASADSAGPTNTGAGAGGVTNSNITAGAGAASGGGGGGEGYVMWIYAPAANYGYSVGAGGAAGTSGFAGAAGKIIVEEFYA